MAGGSSYGKCYQEDRSTTFQFTVVQFSIMHNVMPSLSLALDHTEEGAISSLCYSPDDKHLATGTSTGNVVVFEADSGGPIFTLEKPEVHL